MQDLGKSMKQTRLFKMAIVGIALLALVGCGGKGLGFLGGKSNGTYATDEYFARDDVGNPITKGDSKNSIFDVFKKKDTGVNVKVNRFLWNASLEVLNFLPVQSVDPFTGVIVTGYGTPPGGGRAYRATVYIKDPALDARSLNVAIQTRSGPVAAGTQRAVEDAILARARQLRIADGKL